MHMPEHCISCYEHAKILRQLHDLLEDAYRTFYHIVFLEVCKSCGIIPNGLMIKNWLVFNVSKNFLVLLGTWN